MARERLEVADIFRAHGAAWRGARAGHLSLGQLKVMSAIEHCRTAALRQMPRRHRRPRATRHRPMQPRRQNAAREGAPIPWPSPPAFSTSRRQPKPGATIPIDRARRDTKPNRPRSRLTPLLEGGRYRTHFDAGGGNHPSH